MTTKFVCYLFTCFSFLLFANEPAPELNAAGKRRLEENRNILSQSIEISQTNISNSEQNINTLQKELESLAKIEKKFSRLKNQYEAFLEKAQVETDKNQKAIKRLNKNPQSKMAPIELSERELWSKNTVVKVEKVRRLLQGIKKNLTQVETQKKRLEEQKLHWADRKKYHEKTLEDLAGKKSTTEKLLRGEG